ncbi:MAG: M23 family metallopeptidase [Anaerolineae bacterium]|nr:M23 family metallopeptidase [Anaerolineae bacterium]
MSTSSVRFRPRQGERSREDSSTHAQLALERAIKRFQTLFSHYTVHLVVIALAIAVFFVGQFEFPVEYELAYRATPTTAPSLGFRAFQTSASGRGGERYNEPDSYIPRAQPTVTRPVPNVRSLVMNSLFQAPVAHTTIPDRLRREVITYVVQKGDNLLQIAVDFNLEQDTLMWANPTLERNPDLLRPGQEIIVLPIDGVYHTVVKGDTLAKIAEKYQASVEDIVQCSYNNLDLENPKIAVDDKLIVPGGVKPYISLFVTAYSGTIPEDAKRGTGVFSWPASGVLTDRFGFRTFSGRWHSGLDISGYTGADVVAADSGFVTFAGWSKTGYGNLVIIDHRNGFETRYAHLSTILVAAGQSVGKGQLVALMGSTGNSTGPHLHFEVREQGVRKNPELYLP